MPVLYVPHGGGPWPFVDMGIDRREVTALTAYLQGLPGEPKAPVTALLVISAHWEAPRPTVMTASQPPMYYDYYGFPPASYEITWPAPGSPELAARVRGLLGQAGFETAEDSTRGFDHGTFVPFKVAYPGADVPTIQLSLKRGLDPAEHLALGRALMPLRDEGVLIAGSGMSYHNLRAFGRREAISVSEQFDAWLREAATADPPTRASRLERWTEAPVAREAHPREEHLLPLMVVAGAAGEDRGRIAFDGTFMGIRLSAFHYG
jgi:aromatic ring-opening dioxygenase catalytic subunit (LigB family)